MHAYCTQQRVSVSGTFRTWTHALHVLDRFLAMSAHFVFKLGLDTDPTREIKGRGSVSSWFSYYKKRKKKKPFNAPESLSLSLSLSLSHCEIHWRWRRKTSSTTTPSSRTTMRAWKMTTVMRLGRRWWGAQRRRRAKQRPLLLDLSLWSSQLVSFLFNSYFLKKFRALKVRVSFNQFRC